MDRYSQHMKIARWDGNHLQLSEQGVNFLTPAFNGTFAVGTTITSGSSLPRVKGYRFTLNENGNEISFESLFDVELTGIGLDGSGSKEAFPAYDVSGRLFVKATKSGSATRLRELNPLTGADLGGISLTSSTSPSFLEIDDQSNMYVPGNSGDSVRIFDLDFNLIKTYTGANNPFSIHFAVSPNGDIAMVNTDGTDSVVIQDFDGNAITTISVNDLSGSHNSIEDVRMNNNYIAITTPNHMYVFEREGYTELWTSSTFRNPTFSLNKDEMYVERRANGGTESYIRKIKIEDGAFVWETLSAESSGTAPHIGTIHPISTELLAVWHDPLGRSKYYNPETGFKFANDNGGGRGFMSLHPLSNDRIANFEL